LVEKQCGAHVVVVIGLLRQQGGEDRSIDGLVARLLTPGDTLSLAAEDLFLCARICVTGITSAFGD